MHMARSFGQAAARHPKQEAPPDYVTSVYSLHIPEPNPPLPLTFVLQMPKPNILILKRGTMPEESVLVQELHLSYMERFPALSIIRENKTSILLSEANKTFVGIFILQSICKPFLTSLEVFDAEILRLLLRLLKFATKIVPQYAQFCYESFGFVYEKVIDNNRFLSMLPDIANHFKVIPEGAHDFSPLHVRCFKAIVVGCQGKTDDSALELCATHLDRMMKDISELNDKSVEYDGGDGLAAEMLKFCGCGKSGETFLKLRNSAFIALVEFVRVTGMECNSFIEILAKIVLEVPIVSKEEQDKDIESCKVESRELTHEEVKEAREKVTFSNYVFPEIGGIEAYLHEIAHPMVKLLESLQTVAERVRFSLFKLIISHGYQRINSGDVTLQTFLFLVLKDISSEINEAVRYLQEKEAMGIFFTKPLFNPAITIFNSPSSPLVWFRILVLRYYQTFLDEMDNPKLSVLLLNRLNDFVGYPEILGEVCFFATKIFIKYMKSEELQLAFLCLAPQILKCQQAAKYAGFEHSAEFRSLTFKVLREVFDSAKAFQEYDEDIYDIRRTLVELLYESDVTDITVVLLEKFYKMFVGQRIGVFLQMLSPLIKYLQEPPAEYEYVTIGILKLVSSAIRNLDPASRKVVRRTELLKTVQSLILDSNSSEDTVWSAFKLLVHAKESDNIQWSEIAQRLSQCTMSAENYETVLQVLYQDDEQEFGGVSNIDAAKHLVSLVVNSDSFIPFLYAVKRVTELSVPQCYIVSELNLPMYFIQRAIELGNEEAIDVTLDTLKNVFPYATKRPSLFSFLRVMNPSQMRKSQYIVKFLKVLIEIFNKEVPSAGFLLQTSSKYGKIRLPTIGSKLWAHGFSLALSVLIGKFGPKDCIRLFKFQNHSTNSAISARLMKDKIEVTSTFFAPDSTCVLPVEIPENKEISLVVNFDATGTCLISVDGNTGSTQIPVYDPQTTSFESCILFGGNSLGHVQCQIKRIAVFNDPDYRVASIISDDNALKQCSDLVMRFEPELHRGQQLINVVKANQNVGRFYCHFFQFIVSFREVFERSQGLAFITSLFSQLNLEGTISSKELACTLIDAVLVIMRVSRKSQLEMVKLQGFEIMAHFFGVAAAEVREGDVYAKLFAVYHVLQEDRCKIAFLQDLIFNFELWRNCSIETQTQIFQSWAEVDQMDHAVCGRVIEPSFVIEIIYSLYQSELMNTTIRELLLTLLFDLAVESFQEEDFGLLLAVMHTQKHSLNTVEALLKVLNHISIENEATSVQIPQALLKTQWLCLHEEPSIQIMLIQFFANTDDQLYIQHLLLNIDRASHRDVKENTQLLVSTCAAMIGMENEPDVTFAKIMTKANRWVYRDSLLSISLVLALFSDPAVIPEFSLFLSTVFSSNERLSVIVRYMTLFNLFLLISFGLCKSQTFVDFIILLLAYSPELCRYTFRLLDIFSMIIGQDLHSFQNDLAGKLLSIVFNKKFEGNRQPFVDVLIDFICYRPIFEEPLQTRELSILTLIDYFRQSNPKLPEYKYALKIKDGKWMDLNLVLQLMRPMSSFPDMKLERYLIIFSFALHPFVPQIEELATYLDKYVPLTPSDASCWWPVLFQVTKTPQRVASAKNFQKKFGSKMNFNHILRPMNEEMAKFVASLQSCPDVDDVIINSLNMQLTFTDFMCPNLAEQVQALRKKSETAQTNTVHAWRRLWKRLAYDKSPLIPTVEEPHFKRGNRFDLFGRPIVLVRNNHFDDHSDAAERRGTLSTEDAIRIHDEKVARQNSEFFFDVEKYKLSVAAKEPIDVCKAIWTNNCEKVTIMKSTAGVFSVLQTGYRYVSEASKIIMIPAKAVRCVFWAWHEQMANGVQILTNDHRCFLFKFPEQKNHKFVTQLAKIDLPNCVFFQEGSPRSEIEKLHLTHMWKTRAITNFEYLMWLNLLSGRSFLSSRTYPVYPFLLMALNKPQLDLKDPTCFRDLSKNVSVQTEENAKNLTNLRSSAKFHHVSLFSNPFTTMYYMIRVEPFTKLHITLQDGAFDVASRMFRSLGVLVSGLSEPFPPTREWIPEFFFTDVFLKNMNHFNLGVASDGQVVDDVVLPEWASSPMEFVEKARRALECEYTSQHIHQWIDLIWGYKARGEAAAEALNTYDPGTYPDVWDKFEETDVCMLAATETILNCIGQMPQQLFTEPHAERNPPTPIIEAGQIFFLRGLADSIVSFKAFGNSMEAVKIMALLNNGKVFCLRFTSPHFEIEKKGSYSYLELPKDSKLLAFAGPRSFVFAFNSSTSMGQFDLETGAVTIATSTPHIGAITAVSIANNLVVSGGADACLGLWKQAKKELQYVSSLMVHTDSVTCVAASTEYGIAVSCALDNTMVVSLLPGLTFLRVVDLNLETGLVPTHVRVCETTGYIVVVAEGGGKHVIQNYTVNGAFIRRVDVSSTIIDLCTFVSRRGVDFFAAIDGDKQLVLFDAFTLKMTKVVYQHSGNLKRVEYCKQMGSILVATTDATLFVVPCECP